MQDQVEWFMSQPDDVKKSELAAMQRNNPAWHGVVKQRVIDVYNAQKRATGDDQGRNNVYVLRGNDR